MYNINAHNLSGVRNWVNNPDWRVVMAIMYVCNHKFALVYRYIFLTLHVYCRMISFLCHWTIFTQNQPVYHGCLGIYSGGSYYSLDLSFHDNLLTKMTWLALVLKQCSIKIISKTTFITSDIATHSRLCIQLLSAYFQQKLGLPYYQH